MHIDICQDCRSELFLRDCIERKAFGERYRILKMMGRGRFGVTFLAQDESLPSHPHCVIKQLRPTTSESHIIEIAQVLFKREAETLKQIGNHPQVPQLLEYCEEAQPPYFVEQYINGLTLRQEIRQSGTLGETEVKQFLIEMLPVLEFIHSQKLIHRDIKPSNIVRRQQDNQLVLIDFGAVKNCQDDPENSSEQTTWTDTSIGTQGFAPPEQIAMRPVFASDIYALGVTCIYLLTGKLPTHFPYEPTTCQMVWQPYVQISDQFTEVLNKMLEPSVRYRYQSAQEVLNAIDSLDAKSHLLLESYKNGERNFAFQNMSGLNLQDTNLSGGLFYSSKLAKTNFQGADLSDAYFGQANLNQANLRNANLGGASFSNADLSGADLQGADLRFAYLSNANIKGANLCGANLSNANIKGANLCGANLSNAIITEEQLAVVKKNWTTVLPNGRCGFGS
jgi:serine/threonine-protein kinase